MRNAWPTVAVVLTAAVLVSVGCDSDEPEHATGRTASVTVTAVAEGPLFNCYEVWQDTTVPPDSNPDVNTGFVICDETIDFAQRPVPWRYSLTISVIHAGTVTEDVVTSLEGLPGSSVLPNDGIDDFVSLTDYDPNVLTAPAKDHQEDIWFVNGKTVSRGSPVYLAAMGLDLGVPNILTTSPSFDFAVNSGDTIIVRARKQGTAAAPAFIPTTPEPNLTISGTLSVGGVGASVSGSQTSSNADQAGFAFSYTVP